MVGLVSILLQVLVAPSLLVVRLTDAQVISLICEATSCQDCIAQGCGWVPAGSDVCMKDCSYIADAPCYSQETFLHLNGGVSLSDSLDICGLAEQHAADQAACGLHSDCSTCVVAVMSDGTSTCKWEETFESCGRGVCNLFGCGSDTCNGGEVGDGGANVIIPEPTKCENATDCTECLDANCAWAVGSCLDSCDVIADAACYSAANFPNSTKLEICDVERTNTLDFAICSVPTSCSSCLATVKTDGSSTCEWYEEQDSCGMGGCDLRGCGSSVCPDTATSSSFLGAAYCFDFPGRVLLWLGSAWFAMLLFH